MLVPMHPSTKIFFLFCTFLSLILPSSIAQTSFRPKALVVPLTKDTSSSTPQYVTQIKQRTPLVPVKLTLDLGGPFLWVNCEKGYVSSTSKPIPCASSQCSLFESHSCSTTSKNERDKVCGDFPSNTVTGVSTSGDVHSDVVSVQSTDGNNPRRLLSVPNFLFVCGSNVVQQGLPIGVTGMAGLGRTRVSIPSQFASSFSLERKFAICLSSSTMSTGVVFFGDGPYNLGYLNADLSKVLTFTPLLTNPVSTAPIFSMGDPSVEYFIGVKSIKVNGQKVPLNTTLLSIDKKTGIGGTKISTVNPYTVMETSIYKAVANAFVKSVGAPTVSPVRPFGTCFATKDISFSRMGPAVPSIDLVLQNQKVVWNIIGANSMVQLGDVICLGFVDAGSAPTLAQVGFVSGRSRPMTTITIGAHQLENNFLQFDLAASRLGFSSLFLEHANCANFNFTSSV